MVKAFFFCESLVIALLERKDPGVRTFELIAIEPVALLGVLEIPVGVSFGRRSIE